MKKWVVAIAMGGLIISFQNCSKPNLNGTGSLDASSQENPVMQAPVSTLVPSKAVAVEIPNSPFVDLNVDGNSNKSMNSYSLRVNTQTGVINVLLGNGEIDSSKEFCLGSEQISVLEDLLAHAQLYEAIEDSNPDRICTMDYSYPYAKLHFTEKEVALGEKFSGCHKGADLEKVSSVKLKSFLSDVVSNLKSCNFDAVQ